MTSETIDYAQFTDCEPVQDVRDPRDVSDYTDLAETVTNIPGEADDEEALEQYMSSMLERLTGSRTVGPAVTELLEPIEAVVEALPVEPESQAREPVRPSEVHEDLNGMRELANQTVESALGAHQSGRLVQSIKQSLFVALAFSLVSSLLALFALKLSLPWAYPAAVVAMVAAFLVSFKYFGLSRRLARVGQEMSGSEHPSEHAPGQSASV